MSDEIFDTWNERKKEFDAIEPFKTKDSGEKIPRVWFDEGEIWWCSLGKNI